MPQSFLARAGDRLTGGPGRVPGVDVARGIAVLGMFTAHVGVTSDDLGTLSGWLSVAHGRSSILFATVAGLSLALVTGRDRPLDGHALATARSRLLVRAALLLALVAALDLLGTRVYLILGFYAAYFVLALPFLRWPPRRLLVLALSVALVGPVIVYYGPELLTRLGLRLPHDGSGAVTDFLLTGHYPALVWMAFVLAGMAVGRSDLRSAAVRTWLVVGGFGMTVVAGVVSAVMVAASGGRAAVEADLARTSSEASGLNLALDGAWPTPAFLWLGGPHDDTTLEALGSGGFALGVIGLCLFVGRIGSRVLAPLAAVGALALTVYSAQIVAIWYWTAFHFDLLQPETNVPLAVVTVLSLVAATAWRALLGRGPLERLFARVATRTFPGPDREPDHDRAREPEPTGSPRP
ncbi:heparan-alpha-glucosaminide N-acetyltransferase domain-containing protein [Antribacter gilvus]|uniref:heparan-alpha-glucosaminide N-acetyltransferase domain-containing protein n=1 Tax=Antribacter gilvus TaxID=2304675 RepID=UPI001F0C6757|nr:heparan-alpha-glucosaminide N-acetyltransferase domain-containing protein [Antribacter gilvus]